MTQIYRTLASFQRGKIFNLSNLHSITVLAVFWHLPMFDYCWMVAYPISNSSKLVSRNKKVSTCLVEIH